MATKMSKIIEAGRELEKTKSGFTVPELMDTLKWKEDQRFYVQNAMSTLARQGRAKKLGPNKPIVYTLKVDAATSHPTRQVAAPSMRQHKPNAAAAPVRTHETRSPAEQPAQSPAKRQAITYESLAEMEIPLEMIGEGVFRRNRQLERKIYELESELLDVKRKLDETNRRVAEQARMIEKQNEVISGQNRDRRITTKLRNVTSLPTKRRP